MRPFDDFVKERTYLKNVSPRTIDFYWDCHKSVLRYGDFTEEGLKRWIIGSRALSQHAAPLGTSAPSLLNYVFCVPSQESLQKAHRRKSHVNSSRNAAPG